MGCAACLAWQARPRTERRRVQNAKDTFYMLLRDRMAALYPQRTVVVREVTRPAVLVDENETGDALSAPDCFHLRWTGVDIARDEALPLASLTCEIEYSTSGLEEMGGLDRGRALTMMDSALLQALQMAPQSTTKMDYRALARGGVVTPLRTRVWWSGPELGPVKVNGSALSRAVRVQVMSLEEDGEQ
jgi:hypothetical protein